MPSKNRKHKSKKISLGALSLASTVIGSTILVSCGYAEKPSDSYVGPHNSIKMYHTSATGDPYPGQSGWVALPDTTFETTGSTMGDAMASSSNVLVRSTSVGFPEYELDTVTKDPNSKSTYKNIGDATISYYKFVSAGSITITYINEIGDETQKTFDKDDHPFPRKESEESSKIPWQSINSTPENVIDPSKNATSTFDYILSNTKIRRIAFSIRDDNHWSTNDGEDTGQPVVPRDFWYGLQTLYLSESNILRYENGGSQSMDIEVNSKYGTQLDPTPSGNKDVNGDFNNLYVDTSIFAEGHEDQFTFDNKVNMLFNEYAPIGIGIEAFKNFFIDNRYFLARPSSHLDNTRGPNSPDNLVEKYGFYRYLAGANGDGVDRFENIWYSGEYSTVGHFRQYSHFKINKGFATNQTSDAYRWYNNPKRVREFYYYFLAQTDSLFSSVLYQKYVEGTNVNLNNTQFASLDIYKKTEINSNPKDYNLSFKKSLLTSKTGFDMDWNSALPFGLTENNVYGIPYSNNSYALAMYGQPFRKILTNQEEFFPSYYDHYYTYGSALRSSLSAAINWYSAILTINNPSTANWGSYFASDLPIKGKNDTETTPVNEASMNSEYSYAWDGNKFSNEVSVTPDENKLVYQNNIGNLKASFKSAKFAEIQKNVNTTLETLEKKLQTTVPGFTDFFANPITFELPIRSFHRQDKQYIGLENMRLTLNELGQVPNSSNSKSRFLVASITEYDQDKVRTMLQETSAEKQYALENEIVKVKYAPYNTAGFAGEWIPFTLNRLDSRRAPSATHVTLEIPYFKAGPVGFINKMISSYKYGGLTAFANIISTVKNNSEAVDINSSLHDLWLFATNVVLPAFDEEKMKISVDSLDKSVLTGPASPAAVAEVFKNLDFEKFNEPKSYQLVDGSVPSLGLPGFEEQYKLYQDQQKTPLEKANLEKTESVFAILWKSVADNIMNRLTSEYTAEQIAIFFGSIENYTGRPLEFLLRRNYSESENLPVEIQKSWFKRNFSSADLGFVGDYEVLY